MRILVLGGTVFLSRAVADVAVARGHDVVCAARGRSGSVPDGATLVEVDRSAVALADLGHLDAVVEVAREPSWVRAAVAAYARAHWVFVSTINVYPDTATPGGTPQTLALHEPLAKDADGSDRGDTGGSDDSDDSDDYGRKKVACEQLVRAGTASATILRPGLIVGPGDPTGRFSYWPRRLSRVEESPEVLAPGDPADPVQVIDVRDLATWIVDLAEQRPVATYDAVGPAVAIADLLAQSANGLGMRPTWTWLPHSFLAEQGVEPWSGPASIPLWLPRPEYAGLLAHDVRPSLDAGLLLRPIADTVRDTLAWLEATEGADVSGIGLDRERELLTAWSRIGPLWGQTEREHRYPG